MIFTVLLAACLNVRAAETVTLVAEGPANEDHYSQPITLGPGDVAELVYIDRNSGGGVMEVTIGERVFIVYPFLYAPNGTATPLPYPVKLAGPATLRLKVASGGPSFATVAVTRAGSPSGPIPVPMEAGSTFDVVLESSTDLVNWSPANPGSYSGSAPQLFFRVRVVKKPQG
jgi:hypothetical protein